MPTLPLVGGQDILTPVRLRIGDVDPDNQEFSDDNLNTFLERAILWYGRYRPYYLESTITTVADQQDYLAPANAIKMVEVDWRPYPGLGTNSFVGFWNALYGSADILPMKDWRDEVLNRIRQELAVRFDSLGAGSSGMIQYPTSYDNQSYIRLYPTPSRSGDSVRIRFTANHPRQFNNYFTIPPYHTLYIEKLLEAEIYEARAIQFGSTATDFAAGTTRITLGKSVDFLMNRSLLLRQEVTDALSTPVGRVG